MARIRTIKPEFWTDEKIVSLSPLARLLFIGMWNFVDDEGRAEFSPLRLKMQILPADPTDVSALIGEIRGEGLIDVYDVDGKAYFAVHNFAKHQKSDKRWPSKHPAPPAVSPTPAESPPRNGMEREWNGKEKNTLSAAPTVQDEFALTGERAPPPQTSNGSGYPEDFDDLWREYRVIGSPNSSKADAFKRWQRLNAVDRSACWTGVVRYAVWLGETRQKRPDHPAKHLSTFISERGWEPFLEDAA